ncbi:hypothetical protein BH24DEI1_BH24DEI1_03310 [soil metagenome]|jgi:hypothetical protein|nr:hypothetical protein [Deinococcota bacterium]
MIPHTTSPRLIVAAESSYLIDLFYQDEPRTVGAFLLLDEHPTLIETGP